jgi:hypothetical protein
MTEMGAMMKLWAIWNMNEMFTHRRHFLVIPRYSLKFPSAGELVGTFKSPAGKIKKKLLWWAFKSS